jgi:hypothetical protein
MRALRGILPVILPVVFRVMSAGIVPATWPGFLAAFVCGADITAAAARRRRGAAARLRAWAAPTITAPRFALRTFFRVPRTGPRVRRCPTARLFVRPPRIIVASLVTRAAAAPDARHRRRI